MKRGIGGSISAHLDLGHKVHGVAYTLTRGCYASAQTATDIDWMSLERLEITEYCLIEKGQGLTHEKLYMIPRSSRPRLLRY